MQPAKSCEVFYIRTGDDIAWEWRAQQRPHHAASSNSFSTASKMRASTAFSEPRKSAPGERCISYLRAFVAQPALARTQRRALLLRYVSLPAPTTNVSLKP